MCNEVCGSWRGLCAMKFAEEGQKAISDLGLADQQHELMCWAFGGQYDGELPSNLRMKWNIRHGDVFKIDLTASVYDQFCKIAKAYKDEAS